MIPAEGMAGDSKRHLCGLFASLSPRLSVEKMISFAELKTSFGTEKLYAARSTGIHSSPASCLWWIRPVETGNST